MKLESEKLTRLTLHLPWWSMAGESETVLDSRDGRRSCSSAAPSNIPDQEYQVDGTDPVLPGVLMNRTMGLIPTPVCSGERDDGASPVYLVIPGSVYVVE